MTITSCAAGPLMCLYHRRTAACAMLVIHVLAAKEGWRRYTSSLPFCKESVNADSGLRASQYSCTELAQQQAWRGLRRASRVDCSLACSMSRVCHHHVRHRTWFV